ncbi:thioester domain-containing protein [Pontibacillus litoralis]|uniref:Thioester domain-containing protein n=1 Tax=Pontibacillus litoralis JSM 072002 TaxID=1385512 RepID=A0A0A5HNH3_9BACI|nr:thioester domain-containing protein [Pontibacillus litoralis]KGX85192.1 hypothetical protein N784_09860 [Pontibacillus litoralis JSM 072002]
MVFNSTSRKLKRKFFLVFLALIILFTIPIGLSDRSSSRELENSKFTDGIGFLRTDSDGSVMFEGESLYMEKDGKAVPADFNYLIESDKQNIQLKTKQEIEEDIENSTSKNIFAFLKPEKAYASAPNIVYVGKVSYKGSIVGEFRVNGELAFCLEHHVPTPGTGAKYQTPLTYNNEYIKRALYYGWGGTENIFSNKNQGMVVTSLVLDRIYTGGTTGRNLPGYDALWDKVKNGKTPTTTLKFSDRKLKTYISGNKQISEKTKLIADTRNTVKITVPNKITLKNLTTNKSVTGGTMTVKGGQWIRLEAPLDLDMTYRSGSLRGSMKKFQPMITKPSGGQNLQTLGYMKLVTDPSAKTSFTAEFKKRKRDVTIHYKDKHTGKKLKNSYKTEQLIGSCKTYKSSKSLKKYGKTYDRTGSSSYKVCVKDKDVTKTFKYKLRRNVTVNYLDERTGEKIKNSKSYTVHRGDKYSESHPTIKKGKRTYNYVKRTGNVSKGKVGTKNIEINYHYNLPLVEIGFEKIQIYTAPADEGLPVKVNLSKENIYSGKVDDMKKAKVNVALYQGDTRIGLKEYTAKSLPEKINFKVSKNHLKVNQKNAYTVKFESYSKDDIDVKAKNIGTDGYTSEEKTIKVTAPDMKKISFEGVVMTEREIGEKMKKHYESFQIPVHKLDRMRTGYGFEMPVEIKYENQLGNAVTEYDFNMIVPESIVDKSFLEYSVKRGLATVPLERTKNETTANNKSSNQKFELPHMNVEKISGHLFSDEQVKNDDPRIERDLIDGGREFYIPIWGHVGEYPISVESTKDIGIHEINVVINQNLEVFAHMHAHMDSETIEEDAFLLIPINSDDPKFPANWTEEDKERFFEWDKK